MNGPEGAQARLATYLAAAVPPQLDLLAAELDLADRTAGKYPPLPDPKILPPSEVAKLAVNDFPCLIPVILDTVAAELVDYDAGVLDLLDVDTVPGRAGPQYRVTYVCRIFNFARGKDFDDTNAARQRYALAVRMAILGHPSLTVDDAAVDVTSWRESYSDLDRDAARTIGASYAEFRLALFEDLTAAAPNWVDTVEVETVSMPTATVETP